MYANVHVLKQFYVFDAYLCHLHLQSASGKHAAKPENLSELLRRGGLCLGVACAVYTKCHTSFCHFMTL